MAAKRSNDDVSQDFQGYVHHVTPIKISRTNSKYFNFSLQTATSKYKRSVCFDATKKTSIDAMAKQKSPVKIENALQQPSRSGSDSDLLLNSRSKIQIIKKLDFQHHSQDAPVEGNITHVQLDNAKKLPEKSLVSVTAKVVHAKDESTTIIYGKPTRSREVIAVDAMSQIKIMLWGDLVNKVEEEKSYKFTKLVVKSYMNKQYLSAAKACIITEEDDVQDVVQYVDETDEKKINATILQINITKAYKCMSCSKNMMNVAESKFSRCENCKMLQKTSSYINSLHGILNVQILDADNQDPIKLEISDAVLTKFFTLISEEDILQDAEKVEEYLLEKEKFTFVVLNNAVQSFSSIE